MAFLTPPSFRLSLYVGHAFNGNIFVDRNISTFLISHQRSGMDLESKMFSSHQTNDFWDRLIVFSPKRIVRVLTLCMLVTLSWSFVLWIVPGGRSSRTLAPLQDKAADSTSYNSRENDNVQKFQYPTSESTNLKDASYSSSKSSDLDYSSKSWDLERAPNSKGESIAKEKTKPSQILACPTGGGKGATFTKPHIPLCLPVMTKDIFPYV